VAAPIFTAAVVAALAARKRAHPQRRALAARHHVGLWAWVKRVLRFRGRRVSRRGGPSA
jgi:hypothetical protein